MATANLQVAANGDDAYCGTDGTGFSTDTSGVIRIGSDWDNGDKGIVAGFRFQNVAIPKNATVSNATLTVTAQWGPQGDTIATNIYCADEDDAGAFADSAGNRPDDRALTTAFTVFDTAASWAGDAEFTADIASACEEVFARGGWASGQALTVILKDDGSSGGSNKEIDSYEGDSAAAVTLDITYTAAAETDTSSFFNVM